MKIMYPTAKKTSTKNGNNSTLKIICKIVICHPENEQSEGNANCKYHLGSV